MKSGTAEMSFFIIFTLYASFIVHPSHGFEVIQPQHRTVNPDKVASISCEHTANVSSVEDVRLWSISPTGKASTLCQKGMTDCKNVFIHPENPNKYIFIMLGIGPEAMNLTYQCEVTVKDMNDDVDYTKKGTPTRLLQGQKETEERCTPPPPPPPQPLHLRWILIGLLAVTSLYGCIITSFYIRLRSSSHDCENSTYVEMRKAPPPRSQRSDVHCG